MKKENYIVKVRLYEDEDSGEYVAIYLSLPGCFSHGDTTLKEY